MAIADEWTWNLSRRFEPGASRWEGVRIANQLFNLVTSELGFLGDILSVGITKKAVATVGRTPDTIDGPSMIEAVDRHIVPALGSFLAPKATKRWGRDMKATIRKHAGIEVMI